MHDSGKRQTFTTGAIRDTAEGKIRPDLISPFAQMREGEWMRKGAEKYSERNWEKGIPVSRCIASLFRHLLAYMVGDHEEDHMAAVRTNASFILHFEEMVKRGLLPLSLFDLPNYTPVIRIPDASHGPSNDEQWSPQTEALMHNPPPLPNRWPGVEIVRTRDGTVATAKDGDAMPVYELAGNPIPTPIPTPRLRRVYIAGPMRGIKDFNFPAFDAARDRARALGWEPISPADLDRASGLHENTNPSFDPEQVRGFVLRDTTALLSLRAEHGDAIAVLPGWANSTGAVAELFLARWLGLKVLNAETFGPATGLSENSKQAIVGRLDEWLWERFWSNP